MEIKDLKPEDAGQQVIYWPNHGRVEVGRITSWNDQYVFVDYDRSGRGIATRPEDIELVDA